MMAWFDHINDIDILISHGLENQTCVKIMANQWQQQTATYPRKLSSYSSSLYIIQQPSHFHLMQIGHGTIMNSIVCSKVKLHSTFVWYLYYDLIPGGLKWCTVVILCWVWPSLTFARLWHLKVILGGKETVKSNTEFYKTGGESWAAALVSSKQFVNLLITQLFISTQWRIYSKDRNVLSQFLSAGSLEHTQKIAQVNWPSDNSSVALTHITSWLTFPHTDDGYI